MQLRFVEHYQVIERFAPDRADETLDVAHSATVSAARPDDRGSPLLECDGCTLGRRPRRGRESGDAALRWKRVRHMTCNPLGGRIGSDADRD